MLREFLNKQILFPRGWANSVTRWLTGLNSPSNTISIRNALSPDTKGPEIDVNVDVLAKKVAQLLDQRYMRISEIRNYIDNVSIVAPSGVMRVNDDYVRQTAAR